MYQKIFKRQELKYMIDLNQKRKILEAISPYMELDKYGKTTIRNLYYDTNSYRLIRHSIEKPVYKEKLRLRSYKKATQNSEVFVELKKKYKHIVYKRRLSLGYEDAINWLSLKSEHPAPCQISAEVDYFLSYYEKLKPVCFLSYLREAYFLKDNSDFRLTFDENVLARTDDLSLKGEIYGTKLLEDNKVLMELKCSAGIPLWFTSLLSKEKIFKSSFSKYGTAYKTIILPHLVKEI